MRRGTIAVLLVLCSAAANAQRGPALTLPPANGTHPEEFSAIVGVRELSDGRVLVSDERERRVVVADFAAGNVKLLGRIGSGPGEYQRVSALFALPGDSTLMSQDNGGSWTIFIGATGAISLGPESTLGGARLAIPGGFDSRGNALLATMGAGPRVGIQGLDSLDLFLHARATHREENVGKARSPFGALAGRGVAPDRAVAAPMAGDGTDGRPTPAAFFLMDRVALFPDGAVAIARLQPYRVDWRAPDGKVTVGPVIAANGAYADRDKVEYLQREGVARGKPPRELEKVTGWPEFHPAFAGVASPVLTAPDGKLWISRIPTAADKGNRYDVIDRRGALSGVLILPASERVVGFGAKSVYITVTDADGIQRLRRHPRP